MEIKWYWPMEMLGFVENISAEYQDGYIHYSVSGACDTVMLWFLLGLFPLLFLFGFLTRRLSARAGRSTLGIWLVRSARPCCSSMPCSCRLVWVLIFSSIPAEAVLFPLMH